MALKYFTQSRKDSVKHIVLGFNDENTNGISLKQICFRYLDEIFHGNLLDCINNKTEKYFIRNYNGLVYILDSLKDKSINELGWKNYCKIMNELYRIHCMSFFNGTLVVASTKYLVYKKFPREFTIKVFNEDGSITAINREYYMDMQSVSKARIVLSSLYLYILDNYRQEFENLIELNKFKHLLISEEKSPIKLEKINIEATRDRIFTNFSLDSNCDEVYLFERIGDGQTGSSIQSIINFNSNHPLIHDLLSGFINSLSDRVNQHRLTSYPYRQFFYYFRDSLGFMTDDELNSIEDFNYKVFNKQFRFYKKINYQVATSASYTRTQRHLFTLLLIQFYYYLCNYIEQKNISHNIFQGTNIKKGSLLNPKFRQIYEDGYRFLIHCMVEDVPQNYNRWVIESDKNSADSKCKSQNLCNFTGFKDKSFIKGLEEQKRTFVGDLKKYIWTGKGRMMRASDRIKPIRDFLNYKYDFDNRRKKVISINRGKEKLFPIELIMSYVLHVYTKYSEQSTRCHWLSHVKGFLKHYKKDYRIDEIALRRLSVNDKDYDGGNPIDKADLELISEEFQKRKDDSVRDELFYIIFKFKKTTKLRLGEILNLKRNCICDESFCQIQYYSKTSDGELIYHYLTEEKIADIKRAIEITDEYVSLADGNIKEFIFLSKAEYNRNRISRIANQFTNRFKEIVNSLADSLSVTTYTAYHLRHTFIDTIYTEGIKDGISINRIAGMVGNSPMVANKDYRRKMDLMEYAEAFIGVTISDVDIHGNILETEEEIEELDVVQGGAGACVEKGGCIKIIEGIEDKYICLKCPSFITCISRLPVFKKNIKELKIKLEEATSEDEINFINAQLKLNGAFYTALLDKKGVKKDE